MDRRTFMTYSSLLGLTLPFLPKKTVAACRERWDAIGNITIQRVEIILDDGPITEESYVPYEEYVKWQKANEWDKKTPLKKWLTELEGGRKDYRVFEDGVAVGRLIIHTPCIQFQSYVLDELMTLKNWCDEDIVLYDSEKFHKELTDLANDPLGTAIICVKNFRAKAKQVLDKIITYHNERGLYDKNNG